MTRQLNRKNAASLRRKIDSIGYAPPDQTGVGPYVRTCEVPSGLGMPSRYPLAPGYTDYGGGVRVASMGWSPFDQASYSACRNGTQVYVSAAGNDSTGDGSSGNPYLSLDKAQQIVNAAGVPATIVCVVAAAEEHRRLAGGQTAVKPTAPTAYVARNGIWRGGVYDAFTWSQNTSTFPDLTGNANVWAIARSAFQGVWHPGLLDERGRLVRYRPVASVAAVNRIPGSVYSNGTNVYLSTFDGAQPTDATARVVLNVAAVSWSSFNTQTSVYFDGETSADGFAFDGYCQIAAGALFDASLVTVAMRNVSFGRGNSNSFGFDSINGLVWLERCSGISSSIDVFNFHNVQGADMVSVLLNCEGSGAGLQVASQSNNIVTAHENCRLISAGGRYTDASGGTIRNINTSKTLSVADYLQGDKGDLFQGGTLLPCEMRTDNTAKIWGLDPIIVPLRENHYGIYATSGSQVLLRGSNFVRGLSGGAGAIGAW